MAGGGAGRGEGPDEGVGTGGANERRPCPRPSPPLAGHPLPTGGCLTPACQPSGGSHAVQGIRTFHGAGRGPGFLKRLWALRSLHSVTLQGLRG